MAGKNGNYLLGLLCGAAVGAVAVILNTPHSGEELREKIRGGIEEIRLNYDQGAQRRREELEEEIRILRGEAER